MNKNKNKIILSALVYLGILFFPFFSYSVSEIIVEEGDIGIELTPESPEPYQNVTINLVSYSTDLNKAKIEWTSGGKIISSGFGKKSYSYKAMGPNTSTSFEVLITPSGSIDTITKRITVSPSEVEIMWESVDGYTPPFYKGKTLPTTGSLIRAVAIPNTNTIQSGKGNVSYVWKNNDNTSLGSSGYNKDAYVFKNSMFDTESEITVKASSVSGNYEAVKTISIPTYKPKMIFYKKSPAEGTLYNEALDKETLMTEDEMTIVAEPYFVSLKGNENSFDYTWKINGEGIQTPAKRTEITIKPNSRNGYATINLSMENTDELFQTISNTLKITL